MRVTAGLYEVLRLDTCQGVQDSKSTRTLHHSARRLANRWHNLASGKASDGVRPRGAVLRAVQVFMGPTKFG